MIPRPAPLFATPLPAVPLLRSLAVMLIILISGAAYAASDAATLRATLFETADRALAAARSAQGEVLAPNAFERGAKFYEKAERTLAAGGNLESIQRNLTAATEAFNQSTLSAGGSARYFVEPLRARQRAQFAGANRFAEEEWRNAEKALANAAARLERAGSERSRASAAERASRIAPDIIERYSAAELAAIKANYLQQTRNLLAQAENMRARRVAPIAYARAIELLAEAEAALNEDRYDTDRPRNLARMAEESAFQAVYVADVERRIRDDDYSVETLVIEWENALRAIADLLEVPVQFDTGPQTAVVTLKRAVDALQTEVADLRQGVAERDQEIASLRQELGGTTANLERVNQVLARQERQRARVAKLQALFSPAEGTVLRQDDAVVLRLIGLAFPSGGARLGAEHEALLAKVRSALAEFPEATIVVEGHTDSFGSDTSNQTLSQTRANAVLQYLAAAGVISPVTSTALGFGESRPVASNETPEGRRRNRRIDILIHAP
ncbi:MAG: OmpA family protein [Pseudomonadales bacterium]